jgi:hypothetical protein
MATTDDPGYRTSYYVRVPCPACRVPIEVHMDRPETSGVQDHARPDGKVCWTRGWTLAEVRVMVAMQEENGGRLTRAAHP